MESSLRLYSNPMSRGRVARWMLEEIGEPYEVEYLEYGTSMKAPEFLAINPMGKVPTLVHGDIIVTECAAVCCYLADTFPEAKLAPTAAERAHYYRWMFFTAGPLEAAVTNKSLGVEHNIEKESMLGYGSFEQVLDTLEARCNASDYLAGDRFTAADVYAGSQLGFSMQFGTIEKRPAFENYWERITDREAFRRASALDDAAMGEVGS